MKPLTSDHRLFLTADEKIVHDGHPKAARLLVCAGGEIPVKTVQRLGLTAEKLTQAEKAPAKEKAVKKADPVKNRETRTIDPEGKR